MSSNEERSFECDPIRLNREQIRERIGTGQAFVRRELFDSYRRRLRRARTRPPAWTELGPQPLTQTLGQKDVDMAGRIAGIAVHPDGQTVYAAAGNGGVWRSYDAGATWFFTMEGFDLDPRSFAADTLACGAIAISPHDTQRVFVGTGEAATGAYYGIGPLATSDGGGQWTVEDSSPSLAGHGFFELALDPDNPESVFGATTSGLYHRAVDDQGAVTWYRVNDEDNTFTSVVAARYGGAAVFYAARFGGGISISEDGGYTWGALGEDFPEDNLGRISLAVPGNDGGQVFALAADTEGRFHGLYRLNRSDDRWLRLAGAPPTLFAEASGQWAQAIAVDPNDPSRFFLGGTTVDIDFTYIGALYRCQLGADGVTMTYSFVGVGVHADVQALAFVPGNSAELWAATDGGLFFAGATGAFGEVFESRNGELATLTLNHIGQHPTNEEIYCGTQDNGMVRYEGGGQLRWSTAFTGDCGFVIVNWAKPHRVLASVVEHDLAIFQRGQDGEKDNVDFTPAIPAADGEAVLFYPPLVGTPPAPIDPATASQADRVAFGGVRPWLSDDFGTFWYTIPFDNEDDRLGTTVEEAIRSLAFASHDRLYAGTCAGAVYRYDFDRAEGMWRRIPLSVPQTSVSFALTPQSFRTPITDIAVDPRDATGGSIYVTLGGTLEISGRPDERRLWHYDGKIWRDRSGSGTATSRLLPVQHNAVAIDPRNPDRLWVGADVGVWYSANRGRTWRSFQNGLPDAAVIDLKIHPELRLLRAATHGRGAFEISIDF